MSVMMAGAFVTRSAGCIINDFWDQDFDRQVCAVNRSTSQIFSVPLFQVERTKQRPIASGEVSNFQALTYFGMNGSVALLLLTQLNTYRLYVCMYTHACAHTHTYTHTLSHTCTHTHTHTRMYIYIHMQYELLRNCKVCVVI